MTQDEIGTYCSMNNATSTSHHDIVSGGTVPDVAAGAVTATN